MVSSTRQAITCIVLVLGIVICTQAQTAAQAVASGSISGKVTIKGKPAAGVLVLANDPRGGGNPTRDPYRARTDQTGNYRITNLPAGTYQISVITPALVPTTPSDSIVVAEGEEVADVNFSLVPGGVITGKIADAEREPIIGERVSITPVSEQVPSRFKAPLLWRLSENTTDDRGVYRAFGLPPGKYKVSVGNPRSGMENSREHYNQTFYPSVSDEAKATVIEVTQGSETNNVDIVVGRPVGTFRVAGRVVDGETEKPIPNIRYGVGQRTDYGNGGSSFSSSTGAAVTGANGEFRYENATPGKYTIFTVPPDGSDIPAASVSFEVTDRDVTDLLLKTSKGSTLSGVMVVDGSDRPLFTSTPLRICATVESTVGVPPKSSGAIGPDGTFTIQGVQSGLTQLHLCYAHRERGQFEIVRVERNGIPSEAINLKEREHVAGIRVLVKYVKLTGSIRGEVKAENGELPPISQLRLWLWPLDENLQPKRSSSIPTPELDARGRFFAEGLPAGAYRLTVYFYPPAPTSGRTRAVEEKTQQVTVADDTVTEVTVIIKPQPNPN